MRYYPSSIVNVIKQIAKLPGIGEKTAERLALHLLRAPRPDVEHLAASILDIKKRTRRCALCFAFSDHDTCRICGDAQRDARLLCVVEQPGDMVAIEKSGAFHGRYHILSGALSPMDGIGPEKLRIRELLKRVAAGTIQEVILATSTSMEGEATADYLSQQLVAYTVKITRIASGVPMGGDLKYIDQVTLKRAMDSRRDM